MLKDFINFVKSFFEEKPMDASILYLMALHGELDIETDTAKRINNCVNRSISWAKRKALSGEFQCLTRVDEDLLAHKASIIKILTEKYHFIVIDCERFDKKYKHLLLLDVEGVSVQNK